jgi:hypothetical protein
MNREEMLREARTTEAMRKGYMGLEGKFAVIAKFLGNSIIQQGSRNFDQTFMEDPYAELEEDDILTLDSEDSSYEIGVQFDGLSKGINMTISVMNYLREITCRYEGKIVYQEISGELEGFVPDETWEQHIDNLHHVARTIEKQRRPAEKKKLIETAQKRKNEILDFLKDKWGF